MTDLKHLLDRAADDNGHPLETDLGELLGRARSATRRRRAQTTTVALAGIAALAVAAPLAAQLPLGMPRAPGSPTAGAASPASGPVASMVSETAPPSVPATTDRVLTEAEIVSRCAPQLAKYDELSRWRGGATSPVARPMLVDAWFVVNGARTSYRAGDVVAIGEARNGGPSRLCRIPSEGHEDDTVPFEALVPAADDEDLIAQVCSEAEVVSSRGAPDVRDATVLVAHRAGNVLVAALSRGDDYFACTVPIATLSDRVPFETRGPLRPVRHLEVALNSAVVGPKGGSVSSVRYWGNGFLPPEVTTISLEVKGRAPVSFAVRDGAYAVALDVPIARIMPSRVTLLDGRGKVLHQSPWT